MEEATTSNTTKKATKIKKEVEDEEDMESDDDVIEIRKEKKSEKRVRENDYHPAARLDGIVVRLDDLVIFGLNSRSWDLEACIVDFIVLERLPRLDLDVRFFVLV
ncbi:hypothetical protein Tco_1533389 [Tanacetum coccineum]